MRIEEMSVLESWLSQYEGKSRGNYESAIKWFLKWAETTPEELVKTYKEAPDKNQWAKEWGNILLRFQSEMLEKGIKKNGKPYKKGGVRNAVVAVQSFFSSTCQKLTIRRGRIIPVQMRTDGHIFSINDLRKMFDIADTRDKAILSTAVSLGWSISDFLSLKRKFIEDLIKRARSENSEFIFFDLQRGKTDARTLGILSPEAINWLEQWLRCSEETEFLWSSPRGERLKDDTISDILNRLAKESGIVTTGAVYFHAFRKFLMTSLSNAGLNEFEIKTIVGKDISISDVTYLRIKEEAFSKYKQAYPSFSLIKTEANGKIEGLKEALRQLEKENKELKETIQGLQVRITELQQGLDKVTSRLDKLETMIEPQKEQPKKEKVEFT